MITVVVMGGSVDWGGCDVEFRGLCAARWQLWRIGFGLKAELNSEARRLPGAPCRNARAASPPKLGSAGQFAVASAAVS